MTRPCCSQRSEAIRRPGLRAVRSLGCASKVLSDLSEPHLDQQEARIEA